MGTRSQVLLPYGADTREVHRLVGPYVRVGEVEMAGAKRCTAMLVGDQWLRDLIGSPGSADYQGFIIPHFLSRR